MINLLPSETQAEIRAARNNVVLGRYGVIFSAVLVFMLIYFAGAFYLTLRDTQLAKNDKVQQDNVTGYETTKNQAKAFAANLNAAKSILTNQVSYTSVLLNITNALTPGTVLDGITLTSASFGAPITLSARATSYDTALKLKSQLLNSGVFSNISINTANMSASGGDARTSKYPLSISLSAVLVKQNATATAKP